MAPAPSKEGYVTHLRRGSRIADFWCVLGGGGGERSYEQRNLIHILTPSIRYLEHFANGLQTFSPANPCMANDQTPSSRYAGHNPHPRPS